MAVQPRSELVPFQRRIINEWRHRAQLVIIAFFPRNLPPFIFLLPPSLKGNTIKYITGYYKSLARRQASGNGRESSAMPEDEYYIGGRIQTQLGRQLGYCGF